MLSLLEFFQISGILQPVLFFSYLQIKQEKLVDLQNFTKPFHSLPYSKSQDYRLWLRPIAFETETETRKNESRDPSLI